MAANKETLQAKLNALRADYVKEYPDRVRKLHAAWQSCIEQDMAQNCIQSFHRLAHNIKGSGSTFGYPEISEYGAELHDLLSELVNTESTPDEAQCKLIVQALEKLDSIDLSKQNQPNLVTSIATDTEQEETTAQKVLLVEDDELVAKDIKIQLGHFGYEVHIKHDLDNLVEEVEKLKPMTILIDVVFPDRKNGGIEAIAELKQKSIKLPHTIFLTGREDINARIEAVRAGGSAFMQKPVDISELIDRLDTLAHKKEEDPYRVMIIDDTWSLAMFYATALQSVGIQTSVVTNPMKAMEEVTEFNPELILMDMYMPECDGIELATVIRQIEAYVSVPIVFLSSEKNITKQLQALTLGGDDFLTKPIDPEHLISSVLARSCRYRKLRAFMVRDSLTGLFNHTKTKEMLDTDLARAQRQNGKLVFGMVDIDKFKSVNDTYGHPVGDRVIKSLARLLKQSLRKSDIIGRYGGEEFAVILYDTTLENAEMVMNKIREKFSQIIHKTDDTQFSSTFSCGLAAYPDFTTASELNEEADKALYQAKQGGRNRVCLA